MFGKLLAMGACCTCWPMLIDSIMAFLAGTEIRIRAKDRLSANVSRRGDSKGFAAGKDCGDH